jgi:ornithine carbamoyltransferase
MTPPEVNPGVEMREEQEMATRPMGKDTGNKSGLVPVLTDLTSMSDLTPALASGLLELGTLVKSRPNDFRTALAGKQIVLFFEKPSFRTRLTFELGIFALGGHAVFVDQLTSRIGEREPMSDMAHNLERWSSRTPR